MKRGRELGIHKMEKSLPVVRLKVSISFCHFLGWEKLDKFYSLNSTNTGFPVRREALVSLGLCSFLKILKGNSCPYFSDNSQLVLRVQYCC